MAEPALRELCDGADQFVKRIAELEAESRLHAQRRMEAEAKLKAARYRNTLWHKHAISLCDGRIKRCVVPYGVDPSDLATVQGAVEQAERERDEALALSAPELRGLIAECLALNPTVTGDMEKVRVWADVVKRMKKAALGQEAPDAR